MAHSWLLSGQIANEKNISKNNGADHNIKKIVANLLIMEWFKGTLMQIWKSHYMFMFL